jgi:hypothetical protein
VATLRVSRNLYIGEEGVVWGWMKVIKEGKQKEISKIVFGATLRGEMEGKGKTWLTS